VVRCGYDFGDGFGVLGADLLVKSEILMNNLGLGRWEMWFLDVK
jgi:hypothetical protein